MSQRQEIYAAIDAERAYQREQWGVGRKPEDSEHEAPVPSRTFAGGKEVAHDVGNWIVFMEHHLALAKSELATKDGNSPALHQLRKVVALGVACFENHYCPPRAERPKYRTYVKGDL